MQKEEEQALREALTRIADGDRGALPRAFELLHPLVLRVCSRLLDGPLAEDAAQEALLTLFAHVSAYDPERSPVPWVLAFATNAARTARKRSQRRRELDELPEMTSSGDPESEHLEAELREAVRATIGSLSALDSETLSLAMGERPPTATFRKRFERAARRFRAAWSKR